MTMSAKTLELERPTPTLPPLCEPVSAGELVPVPPPVVYRKRKHDKVLPPPPHDWFIDSMRFREARAHAAANGQYTPGAMRTRIAQVDCGLTQHPAITHWPLEDRALGRDFMGPVERPWLSMLGVGPAMGELPFVGPLGGKRAIPPAIWPNHGTSTAYMILGDASVPRDDGQPAPGGVLPDARLIPYRISRSIVSIHGGRMNRAFDDAIANDCKVITMSHLIAFRPKSVDEALTKAYEAGVIVCAAAGSHFLPLRRSFSRIATSPMAIGVGCAMHDDTPWYFTHASPSLDILAPAYDIVSPYTYHNVVTGGSSYGFFVSEGSSYATPLTAAAAALWVEHHGDALDRYSDRWMRVEAFKYCLQHSARAVRGVPDDQLHLYGAGVIDVLRLVQVELPPERILRKATVRPKEGTFPSHIYLITDQRALA